MGLEMRNCSACKVRTGSWKCLLWTWKSLPQNLTYELAKPTVKEKQSFACRSLLQSPKHCVSWPTVMDENKFLIWSCLKFWRRFVDCIRLSCTEIAVNQTFLWFLHRRLRLADCSGLVFKRCVGKMLSLKHLWFFYTSDFTVVCVLVFSHTPGKLVLIHWDQTGSFFTLVP